MLEWFRKRRQEKLESSGGLTEKRQAIEKTNAVADEVLSKMKAISMDRRTHVEQIPFAERRMA